MLLKNPKKRLTKRIGQQWWFRKNDLDEIFINILTPLPSTPLWDYAESKGLVGNALKRRIIDGTLSKKDVKFLSSGKRC